MKKQKSKRTEVLEFFKNAFCVDKARIATRKQAREIVKHAEIYIVELTDSKRGTFYIARLIPKENIE